MSDSKLVYSTDMGRITETSVPEQAETFSDGAIRVRRETKGRKGKGVITIAGIPLVGKALKDLAKKLKQKCGTGGAVKDGIIEIQGDQRDLIKVELEKLGYTVKLSGG